MRSVGLKVLKNKLSEYVRLVAGGETVLITDRDRVVAELVPLAEGRAQTVDDVALAELVRNGWLTPLLMGSGCRPVVSAHRTENRFGSCSDDSDGSNYCRWSWAKRSSPGRCPCAHSMGSISRRSSFCERADRMSSSQVTMIVSIRPLAACRFRCFLCKLAFGLLRPPRCGTLLACRSGTLLHAPHLWRMARCERTLTFLAGSEAAPAR